MSTIITRAGKGSPLTNNEVDANFINLNTDKAELSGASFTGSIDVTGTATMDGLVVDGTAALTSGGTTLSVDRTGGATALIELKQASVIRGYLGADSTKSLIAFNGSGAEKFSVSNAGIDVTGTATMDGLTVSSDSGGPVYLQDSNATATYNISELSNNAGNFGIQTRSSSGAFVSTDYQIVKNASGADYHRWFTQGTERLRIDSSGNVGIGTTSPSTKLEVNAGLNTEMRVGTTVNGSLQIGHFSNGTFIGTNTGTPSVADLVRLGTGGTERMRIDSAGRVLIGITGASGFGSLESNDLAITGQCILARSSGSVLVGTTTAYTGGKLSVNGGIVQPSGNQNVIGVFGTSGLQMIGQTGAESIIGTMGANEPLVLRTGSVERFRIASDGSLSTPTAGTSNVRFGVNAGNSIIAGGNYNVVVGDEAGTAITTGDYNVSLGAYALGSEDTGSRGTAIGYAALYTQNAGDVATHNTAVGYSAGYSVTTGVRNTLIGGLAGDASTTANYNTALGYTALGANTTGDLNTAIGDNALATNTTATGNTAVGQGSLQLNTTGANNVAIGYTALDANTTASNNTAVGTYALTSNTTASNNTAVGTYSGNSNTTGAANTSLGAASFLTNTAGSFNTALGGDSLRSSTTASNNTAVGYNSLRANTTGANNVAVGSLTLDAATTATGNTAVGQGAMSATTTGASNVAMGLSSLYTNTTGANNTAIGYSALFANTIGANNTAVGKSALVGNTTGSSNTAIGWSAGSAITTGQANLCIGYTTGNYQAALTTGTGNVLVGPYCDAVSATANDQHCFGYNLDAASGYTTLGAGSNDIRAAFGSTTWSTVSDERYKKDIVDSTAGLGFINALQPRTFNYRTLGELPETFSAYEEGSTEVFKSSQTQHGFIAQEIKAAIDADDSIKDGFKLWDDREDGSQEVAEAALIPVLVKAVQELSTQLDAALARIETLEG